jgi:hypothetical protein
VTTRSTQPPWEFLLSASKNSLQSFELSRLSHAADIRNEIGALLDQWMDDHTNATLARLLLQERERSSRKPDLRFDREPRRRIQAASHPPATKPQCRVTSWLLYMSYRAHLA